MTVDQLNRVEVREAFQGENFTGVFIAPELCFGSASQAMVSLLLLALLLAAHLLA
jgi:hypothetical protein